MQHRQYPIRKAVVLGAGTMGAAIAAHCANAGIQVHLLDIVPSQLTEEQQAQHLTLADVKVRNSITIQGWEQLLKSSPPPLMSSACADLVRLGNLEDDLLNISEADWVIEAVIEDIQIKRSLFEKVDALRNPHTIVSTNTSGIPIAMLAEGRSLSFRQHFLGTHFFNPPRYLKLLELIPTADTLPQVVDSMDWFCETMLGKGVVRCKDTPNFIGNRLFCGFTAFTLSFALEHGYSVDEVDHVTGPFMGRPKTATFRLLDLIGIDVMHHILHNLSKLLKYDTLIYPYLTSPKLNHLLNEMIKRNWLGNKTKIGFYKVVVGKDGKKEFWILNLNTLEHEPTSSISRSDSLARASQETQLIPRLNRVLYEEDRMAVLAQTLLYQYFSYASHLIPEVADSPLPIDQAMRWGFAHQFGPFECWEQLGIINLVDKMQAAQFSPASWVEELVQKGKTKFYKSQIKNSPEVYCPPKGSFQPIKLAPYQQKPSAKKSLYENTSASLTQLADETILLLLHGKMNVLNHDAFDALEKALDFLDKDGKGLLIATEAEHFSAGADLAWMLNTAQAAEWRKLDQMIARFQQLNLRLKSFHKPIVGVVNGYCLGGGAELMMHCQRVVAAAELNTGLVELNVGLIPAGGGTKEMIRRVITPPMRTSSALVLPYLLQVLQQLAAAKISNSAREAKQLRYLSAADRVIMNRDHLLYEGLRELNHLADSDKIYPVPQKLYAAGRDGLAAMKSAIVNFKEAGQITAYDSFIIEKLAAVLCGGELSTPQWLEETYFLDLEREAFLSLCGEKNTQDRISYMLKNGKPLRN